jgi:hypothetical protein
MSSAFHSFFDIKPASNITNPEPTYQKSKGKVPQTLDDVGVLPDIELEDFASSKNHHGRQASGSEQGLSKGAQTPRTPNELEMSRPSTPRTDDAIGTTRTWNGQSMTKWRILCCCLIYLSNGINDSGTWSHREIRRVCKYVRLLTQRSRRCFDSLHGDLLSYLVLYHVPGLRGQRRWFHQRCILHKLGSRQVWESKDVDLCRADTAICIHHACVYTAVPCRDRIVSTRSIGIRSLLTPTASSSLALELQSTSHSTTYFAQTPTLQA